MSSRQRVEEATDRLDHWLSEAANIAKNEARRWIEAGLVTVDGRRAKKSTSLSAGSIVCWQELTGEALPDASIDLDIRYEDQSLVIVNKPAGMPCHPLRAHELGTLANALTHCFPQMRGVGFDERQPGLVNRLDNDTSGLVIAAKNASAFAELRELLEASRVAKSYVAIVEGELEAPRRIDACIVEAGRRVRIDDEGKPARTEIVKAQSHPLGTLIEVSVHRAVRHQIRAHLAHIGHPLVGDVRYGAEATDLGRHLLHASSIAFTIGASRVEASSEAPFL